jgi:uroporphyrinogen-III synthase
VAQVLLLTPPDQARDLAFLLEEEGHEPCFLPVVPTVEELPRGLRAVAEQVHRLTWIIAIGRAPVRAFLEAVNGAGTRDRIRKVQWLASDAATARVIERQGGVVRVPGDGKWTSAVSGLLTAEDEALVLHEGVVPEILLDSLDAAGLHFSQVELSARAPSVDLSGSDEARVVIVHSAAAGEAWAELTRGAPMSAAPSESCCGPGEAHVHVAAPLLKVSSALRVVASSPAAAQTLESLGVPVYATARGATADAVVDAALEALTG